MALSEVFLLPDMEVDLREVNRVPIQESTLLWTDSHPKESKISIQFPLYPSTSTIFCRIIELINAANVAIRNPCDKEGIFPCMSYMSSSDDASRWMSISLTGNHEFVHLLCSAVLHKARRLHT